ncbi:MAG TPA: DUF4331 domain-containing protein [Actinomycetota bacterium]|nr:DUF4331 domain-containing protein [Actinomycetota bacterium]
MISPAAERQTSRGVIAGFVAGVLAVAVATAAFAPRFGNASSHREAPLVSADPQVDGTDLYAFVSPDAPNTVTFLSNWIPFEEGAGGPNFYSFAAGVRYDINISNDADAKPEIIYRWKFKNHTRNPNTFLYNTGPVTSLADTDLNIYQTYDLQRVDVGGRTETLVDDAIVAPNYVGAASMPNYEALSDSAITSFGGGGKTFTGPIDDPFFLDLRVFDLVYGADFSEGGDDTLAGFNVHTMALQVPKTDLAKGGNVENGVIGVWTTASRRSTRVQGDNGAQSFQGKWVQLSRLGMPLVNEVVVPVGLKDYFNASKPKDDEQYLAAVQDPELPHIVDAVYGLPVPDSDPDEPGIQRSDLIAAFLTGIGGLNQPANVEPAEMLRLNMNTPLCEEGCAQHSSLGVIGGDTAGFPNGRRLADDIIDAALQVVEGELIGSPNDLSDGVNANDKSFRNTFPYAALPTSGSEPSPH